MAQVDLTRYARLFIKWLWLFVLAAALSGGVSYMQLRKVPKVYVSSTTLMVGNALQDTNPSGMDFSTAQNLAEVYAQTATSQPILEATVQALKLPMSWQALQSQVLAVHSVGSQTLEIRAVDVNPQRAQLIASEVAAQVIAASPTEAQHAELETRQKFILQQMDDLQTKIEQARADLDQKQKQLGHETSARAVLDLQDEIKATELNINNWQATYATLLQSYGQGSSPNAITVVSPALVPTQPQGPRTLWTVGLASAAGLLLAVVGVLVIEFLDDTIRGKDELEGLLNVPVVGLIGQIAGGNRSEGPSQVLLTEPESAAAEGYRSLATSVQLESASGHYPTLLVTSAAPSDGKSSVATNLAAAMAQNGRRTILVDLDLREPALTKLFGAVDAPGVTTLVGEVDAPPDQYLVNTAISRLKLLPSGPIQKSPEGRGIIPAVALNQFGEYILPRLREQADVVVVDCPPLLAGSDAVVLSSWLDATILVARSGRTRRGALRAARELLEHSHARLVGTVLNAIPEDAIGYHGYPYYPKRKPRGIARLIS